MTVDHSTIEGDKRKAAAAMAALAVIVVVIIVCIVVMGVRKDKFSVSWDMSSILDENGAPLGYAGRDRVTDYELLAPLTRYSAALAGESAGTANQMQSRCRPPAYAFPDCRWRASPSAPLPPQVGEQIGPLEYNQFGGLPPNWNLPSLPVEVLTVPAASDHYDVQRVGATPALVWSRPGGSCGPGYDNLQIPDRDPLVGATSF